ncbi:hypothetical protein SRHO_G00085140 [Serrasalmus rhombeus]
MPYKESSPACTKPDKQFKMLHQFLQDEEIIRIAALKVEEETKSWIIKMKINELENAYQTFPGQLKP